VVHADYGYSGGQRRMPRYMARGAFNQFGYDKGINAIMTHNSRGLWELEVCLSILLICD
jgi:alpha-1,3-glucan synthase